jgi:hypothetical protein
MDTQRNPGKQATADNILLFKSDNFFPKCSETVHSLNLYYNHIIL